MSSTTPAVWKRVGILGGGQLGLMLADAGRRLNVFTTVLDPTESCPAAVSADAHILGSFKDADKIDELAAGSDVLTVEIEHINADAYGAAAEKAGIPAEPTANTVRLIQDKYLQKVHLQQQGVPLGEFRRVENATVLSALGEEWGYPLMLKSRCGAYDGRGNAVIAHSGALESSVRCLLPAEAADTFMSATTTDEGITQREGLYVERWVPFQRELAVMVARSVTGECVAYPAVETVHTDNICHVVIAPAPVSEDVQKIAQAAALQAVSSLQGAGVFGVELFHTQGGDVLLNEIAPRPHNSGHYTIEACECSQYEQHLRCILGLPLGSTAMRVPCSVMVNVLGAPVDATAQESCGELPSRVNPAWLDERHKQTRQIGSNVSPTDMDSAGVAQGKGGVDATWDVCARALAVPGASVHWYGKRGSRPGRKVGHITITGRNQAEVYSRVAAVMGPAMCSQSQYARFSSPAPVEAAAAAE